MGKLNWGVWAEEDQSPPGGAAGGPAPPAQPQPAQDPSAAGPAPAGMGGPAKEQDVSQDPQVPDMPQGEGDQDFLAWRRDYFKQSVKGDTKVLIDLLNKVRDQDLDEHQDHFVETNLQVQYLRENANINKASADLRKALKQDLDQNNPSVSMVGHLSTVLDAQPELINHYIRIKGTMGLKGELHRRYTTALFGGVQVGVGANTEDFIYEERQYSIRVSTRFNSTFGNVHLGAWSLRGSDPEDFLEPAELKRLQEGSPREREVMRERVIMESIASQFLKRAFVIQFVGSDGTLYTLGMDLGNALQGAYSEGKLVVKTRQVEGQPAMITQDGQITPFMDVKILYAKETGEVDEDGKPDHQEAEFVSWRDGQLFLTAQLDTLRDAANSFSGIVFKEVPYKGNPSDLKTLARGPINSEVIITSRV
jgi:hypothetical protein